MKKIFFLLSTVALVAVSCSTDEGSDIVTLRSAENRIGFLTNTTRADIVTLDILKADADGFMVYATNGTSPTAWHDEIKGANNYIFTSGEWGWEGVNPMWSADAADYPMNFYAYYASDYTDIAADDSAIGQLAATYTADTDGQVDIITATATTGSRPLGDKVPLTFKHILSKVGFGVALGDGITSHVQAIGFNTICNNRSFTVADPVVWATQPTGATSNYSYLDTKQPAIENSATAAIPGTRGELMMVPQVTKSWVPNSALQDAYIYVLYRLEKGADTQFIGYKNAADHPDYDSTTDAAFNNKPLFVKVAFPVAAGDMEWKSGFAYTYNINLGTPGASNGYLADENFYDENGVRTTFEVENKDEGDMISEGYINFTVDVEPWDTPVSNPVL